MRAPVRALQPEHRYRLAAENRCLVRSRRRRRPTSCRPAGRSLDDAPSARRTTPACSAATRRCQDHTDSRKANSSHFKNPRSCATPARTGGAAAARSAVCASECIALVERSGVPPSPAGRGDPLVYARTREWDASARRPTPGIRLGGHAVLGFALRRHTPGEPLRCAPHVDRAMVQSFRRTLVARLVLSSACGRTHGRPAMHRDAPGRPMSQSSRMDGVGRGRTRFDGRIGRLAVPRS